MYAWQRISLLQVSAASSLDVLDRMGHPQNSWFATPENTILTDEEGYHHTSNYSQVSSLCVASLARLHSMENPVVARHCTPIFTRSTNNRRADSSGPPPPARVVLSSFPPEATAAVGRNEISTLLTARPLINDVWLSYHPQYPTPHPSEAAPHHQSYSLPSPT
jgi:hypothetical protein